MNYLELCNEVSRVVAIALDSEPFVVERIAHLPDIASYLARAWDGLHTEMESQPWGYEFNVAPLDDYVYLYADKPDFVPIGTYYQETGEVSFLPIVRVAHDDWERSFGGLSTAKPGQPMVWHRSAFNDWLLGPTPVGGLAIVAVKPLPFKPLLYEDDIPYPLPAGCQDILVFQAASDIVDVLFKSGLTHIKGIDLLEIQSGFQKQKEEQLIALKNLSPRRLRFLKMFLDQEVPNDVS